jgi:hypothetical protein
MFLLIQTKFKSERHVEFGRHFEIFDFSIFLNKLDENTHQIKFEHHFTNHSSLDDLIPLPRFLSSTKNRLHYQPARIFSVRTHCLSFINFT